MPGVDGQVQWDRLDQPTFDRFVEPLITRLHLTDDPELQVDVIDGRGGDGGIDIDVRKGSKLLHIYQLKFFPEGFSGGWARSRKPQIKRSFSAAVKLSPKQWTLIIPRNPTVGERDYIQSLNKVTKLRLSIMGRARLDELMARFPDLLHWATREPLIDVLRKIRLDQHALDGADEYQKAIEGIQEIADARSPNWRAGHTFVNGQYVETLEPKHPLAQQREPVGLESLRIEIPIHEEELADRADRVLRYGDNETLTLTSEYLKDVKFHAPSWSQLSLPSDTAQLMIPPSKPLLDDVPVEFQVVDDEDVVIRSYAGRTTHFGRGYGGATLRATINGGIDVSLFFDLPKSERDNLQGTFTFTHKFGGIPASEAVIGARFVADTLTPQKIRLVVNGNLFQSFMGGQINSGPQESKEEYLASESVLLIEDLAIIERELQLTLPVPETITNQDRLTVRIVRLLLEGSIVIDPFKSSLNGTLTDSLTPHLIEMIRDGAGAIVIDQEKLVVELLSRKIALGPARFAIRHAEIANSEEIIAAIEANNSKDHPIRIVPHGDEGIKVFLLGRVGANNKDLVVSPWGVPGIPEHNELRGISDPPKLNP